LNILRVLIDCKKFRAYLFSLLRLVVLVVGVVAVLPDFAAAICVPVGTVVDDKVPGELLLTFCVLVSVDVLEDVLFRGLNSKLAELEIQILATYPVILEVISGGIALADTTQSCLLLGVESGALQRAASPGGLLVGLFPAKLAITHGF